MHYSQNMSCEYNNEIVMMEEICEGSWVPYNNLTSEKEEVELNNGILDDLLNTISPSGLNESEILDDISFNLDCMLANEDEALNDFISSINMQLDTVSNESDNSSHDFDSFPKTSQISEIIKKNKIKENYGILKTNAKRTSFKTIKLNNTNNNIEKKLKTAFETTNKKQSNKEAAIRYRQKKIKERLDLFATRDNLKNENEDLKKKIQDIQLEISFVKNILVEMLLKKV